MARTVKSLTKMNSDSLRYLAEHTDLTFLTEGSIARALVEATNLEISRTQQYLIATESNSFLDTAQGYYLDLKGKELGVTRREPVAAGTVIEDQNVQFSVAIGSLAEAFPNNANLNEGLIPAGTRIQTADGTIVYTVAETVVFSKHLKSVFVPVVAKGVGDGYNVGKNKLTVHNGPTGVSVTNLKTISNGADREPDKEYRFRLANSIASGPTGNRVSVQLAALGNSDVANVVMKEFARGAGTFDILLVPVGNTVSSRALNVTQRAIEQVSAFGVSPRVVEPTYVRFKISVQLVPADGVSAGAVDVGKLRAKNAILDYFETVAIGGEMIVNQLRSAIMSAVSPGIKDIRIVELCFNGRPHAIRNYSLKSDSLFTPDNTLDIEAVQVI